MAKWVVSTNGTVVGNLTAPNRATAMMEARAKWPGMKGLEVVSAIAAQFHREETSARKRDLERTLEQVAMRKKKRRIARQQNYRYGPKQEPLR